MTRMQGLAAKMGSIMGGNPQFTAEFSSRPQVQQTAFRPTGMPQAEFSPQGLPQQEFQARGIQMGQFSPRGVPQQQFRPGGLPAQQFSPGGIGNRDFSPQGITPSAYSPKYRPPGASGDDGRGIGDELFPDQTGGKQGGSGSGATGLGDQDPRWANIDRYSALIDQAAAEVGIDGDIFRAIMFNESGGDPRARHAGTGASGLLQLMPSVWQGKGDPFDPAQQMKMAAGLMKEKLAAVNASYQRNGLNPDARTRALDLALAWAGHFNYETGRQNPNSLDPYVNQDAAGLAKVFLANYDTLKAQRAKQGQGAKAPGTTTKGIAAVWGGQGNVAVTQEFGQTEFSSANAGIYDYATCFGLGPGQHTGLDVGTRVGQQIYTPVGGTVIIAGCGPGGCFFKDERLGAGEGRGELRIRLDNGHELILGHMSQINVKVGQRVDAGMAVGLGGFANGDHTHVEYRIPANTPCGQRIVDPRDFL